ncbi:MAG: NUDIX domain-containing protein [Terracoccus sp.]
MTTLPLGSAGWMEKEPDGSFRVQLKGPVNAADARRLGEWLREQSGAATGGAEAAVRVPVPLPIDRSVIRVKAMLVAPSHDLAAHAVSVLPPSAEQPHGYHRFIGGSVELGETHREAIVREVHEELGATVRDLTYVDVVENIFRLDGVLGHEVVFIYRGRLHPEPAQSGAQLTESDGSVVPVVWRPFDDALEPLPLFPAGVARLALDLGR